ncbi:MAG: MBOAT family protein [Oscillospiraceae bacterium]|nr:MBOAT family protein [Oscillospiraceae bacterium]
MLFSSVTFLYLFLPVTVLAYFVLPKAWRNAVLLGASLLFYFFGEPVYTLLLVFSSVSDFAHSLYIERHRGEPRAKTALISSIVINLGMLGFFKYADFCVGSVNALLGTSIPALGVPLPIGISFFTFQTMSYTIDVYRGHVHAQRNLATLATYVCLFPQLIAGPIVRYSDVAAEMHSRKVDLSDAYLGTRRFVLGLAKKVLIANAMGELCAAFRATDGPSVLFFWLYAAAFTLQIYFDFSGYSDMAIGLGRVFGFRFPENFDYPYLSRSVTEFWRRWHMTLGGWFRDYVYIPLGGNRVSKAKWLRNIAVVWLLTGLWHGAAWNFVLWGALFGLLLTVEKLWLGGHLARAGRVLPHLYVMFVVTVSFVIFNADGMAGAAHDLAGMFGLGGVPLLSAQALYALRSYGVLLAVAIFGATPVTGKLAARFAASKTGAKLTVVLEPLVMAALLAAVTAYLVDGSFNPFLYFRF